MKHITATLIIFIFSSFTICQKMTMIDGRKYWRMNIYPTCSDSTTFIEIEYLMVPAYSSQMRGEKRFTFHKEGLLVKELVNVNGEEKYNTDFSIESDTGYTEEVILNKSKHQYSSFRSVCHPKYHTLQLNDSLEVAMIYFGNGTIRNCELSNRKKYGRIETIEWDSSYDFRWQGNYIKLPIYGDWDTAGISRDPLYEHQFMKKTGAWKKYDNFTGALLDSIDHK